MSTKRRIVRMVTLVAALSALGGGLAWSAHTPSDTIFVDATNCPGPGDGSKRDPFCTIQDAVNHASPGHTIVVRRGTYPELVTLAGIDSLHLRGKGSPKIQCPPSGATVMGISLSEGNIFEGFEITNCVIGIRVSGDGNVVANNEAHGNTLGIEIFGKGNKISDNSVEGQTSHGIVANGRLNVIENNKMARNAGWGLLVIDEDNVLKGNEAVENGFGGYEIQGPADNTTLVHNVAENNQGDGFRVRGVPHIHFVQNQAAGNQGNGFSLVGDASEVALIENNANGNEGHGFSLTLLNNEAPLNTMLLHNEAEGNTSDGFHLEGESVDTESAVLMDNVAEANGGDGFHTDVDIDGSRLIENNADRNEGVGMRDDSSGTGTAGTANIYTDNDCTNNGDGNSDPVGLCNQ